MNVGFLGLGDQGAPMAQAVSENGERLIVWARRQPTIEAIQGLFPFETAESVASLGRTCEIVAICVDRDSDVEELLFDQGLVASMRPGSIIVNHGTGAPAAAKRFCAMSHGRVDILDAPVSGGGEKARSRTLTMMVGGDQLAFDRCRPLFETYASLVRYVGSSGCGQIAKLINNALLALNLWSAEAILATAVAVGLELESFTEILLASSGSSIALQQLAATSPELLLHYRDMLGKDVAEFEAMVVSLQLGTAIAETARQGVNGISQAIQMLGRSVEPPSACRFGEAR